MYSISPETRVQHQQIIEFIYHTALVISAMFLCYPFIIVLWNISVPYMLVFAPTILVIISNFGQFQLMVLMLNMIIIAFLIRWHVAILLIAIGLVAAIKYYTYYIGFDDISENITNMQFKIAYLLLLLSSILIAFIKPKQELLELTEEKVEHLGIQVHDREEELEKSQELKYEFLRNLEHEVHTPVTGIISLAQVLDSSYDKLSEEQRRDAIKTIAASAERFNSITNNLLDLSHLSSLTIQLTKTNVNLSELVYDRLNHCKKLYINNKELEFVTEVQPNIETNCDQHYITSTLDNLIINAIQYSGMTGKITIKLIKIATAVEFSIQDEGIGIPQNELHNIFGAFTVSSKTRTPAGGRGIGLALCEKAIKAHGGEISAVSDGEKGAVFKFNLPTSRLPHFF
jgi:signal transduction histidine kinase